MAFIRIQKMKHDDQGRVIGGTAAIIDTFYDGELQKTTKGHSKQVVREKLGLPLWISDDKKSGIFLSPTRGLVSYDVNSDAFGFVESDDPRVSGTLEDVEDRIHTVFGDAFIFLSFLKNTGLDPILASVFPDDDLYQRCICHLFHTIMKNGDRSRCDLFIEKSFVSYVTPKAPSWSLRCDTAYFTEMGSDAVRIAFFKGFAAFMKKAVPGFGRACYMDSTPLPNDIDDNPFNALCSHGTGSPEIQMRLVLVIDSITGLPVWYELIPGNVLDLNTLKNFTDNVKASIDVEITEYVLDAGYASKELIQAYPAQSEDAAVDDVDCDEMIPERNIVVRMPAKKGYPFKTLYHDCKPLMSNGKYDFVRDKHMYFGIRRKIEVFETEIYAYVYVDQDNALRGYRQYVTAHEDEFNGLTDKDKTWYKHKFGFFVLLSSIPETPAEMLDRYFGRTQIEAVFKTAKEYLNLLPLCKWTAERVRGKILNDIIALILYLKMRGSLKGTPYSMTEVITCSQSLMCFKDHDTVMIEKPKKQLSDISKDMGLKIPTSVSLSDYRLSTTG